MKRRVFIFAVVLIFAYPISGEATTGKDNYGNKMFSECTSKDAGIRSHCLGYVIGFRHAVFVINALYKTKGPFCVSRQATHGQLQDIFVNYLRSHPETRHEFAGLLFVAAMNEKFPC